MNNIRNLVEDAVLSVPGCERAYRAERERIAAKRLSLLQEMVSSQM